MKWIWSIGNKINDGHKALAVVTLNNLSLDASLLLLHDALSVFTTLCSNSWSRPLFNIVQQKQKVPLVADKNLYIGHKEIHLTLHFFSVTHMCHLWWETGWPPKRTKGCFVQPGGWGGSANHRLLPCSSMKSSWKPHFTVASCFQVFFCFFFVFWDWCLEVYVCPWNFRSTETGVGSQEISAVTEWWRTVNGAVQGIRVMEQDILFGLAFFVHIFHPLVLAHLCRPAIFFIHRCWNLSIRNICSSVIHLTVTLMNLY